LVFFDLLLRAYLLSNIFTIFIHYPSDWLPVSTHLGPSYELILFELMFVWLYVIDAGCISRCKTSHFKVINLHPSVSPKLRYPAGQGAPSLSMSIRAQLSNQTLYYSTKEIGTRAPYTSNLHICTMQCTPVFYCPPAVQPAPAEPPAFAKCSRLLTLTLHQCAPPQPPVDPTHTKCQGVWPIDTRPQALYRSGGFRDGPGGPVHHVHTPTDQQTPYAALAVGCSNLFRLKETGTHSHSFQVPAQAVHTGRHVSTWPLKKKINAAGLRCCLIAYNTTYIPLNCKRVHACVVFFSLPLGGFGEGWWDLIDLAMILAHITKQVRH
jgi:hypothetical protein